MMNLLTADSVIVYFKIRGAIILFSLWAVSENLHLLNESLKRALKCHLKWSLSSFGTHWHFLLLFFHSIILQNWGKFLLKISERCLRNEIGWDTGKQSTMGWCDMIKAKSHYDIDYSLITAHLKVIYCSFIALLLTKICQVI